MLRDMPIRLQSLLPGQEISDAQFTKWLEEERKYLESKKHEPEHNVLATEYVELLRKCNDSRAVWELSKQLSAETTGMNNQERLRRVTHDAWEAMEFLQQELQKVEEHLDIGIRWTVESPEYQQAVEYLQIRHYQLAVDKLEGLVVQRLFELTKANLSQTGKRHRFLGTHTNLFIGYKLRMHISKALQTRSKAIQRALKAYNEAALRLDPPRPKLIWSQIVEYTTLAEFELLRSGAREDIRNLDWAEMRHREASTCHLKILRAQEEIERLNIEVKRLATWMVDDEAHLQATIKKLEGTEPLLAKAVTEFASDQKRVNSCLRATLEDIYQLEGYTGDHDIGQKGGCKGEPEASTNVPDTDSEFSDDDVDNALNDMFEGVMKLTLGE
jgi:hypothetical protein